jgi:hypothetical protein
MYANTMIRKRCSGATSSRRRRSCRRSRTSATTAMWTRCSSATATATCHLRTDLYTRADPGPGLQGPQLWASPLKYGGATVYHRARLGPDIARFCTPCRTCSCRSRCSRTPCSTTWAGPGHTARDTTNTDTSYSVPLAIHPSHKDAPRHVHPSKKFRK